MPPGFDSHLWGCLVWSRHNTLLFGRRDASPKSVPFVFPVALQLGESVSVRTQRRCRLRRATRASPVPLSSTAQKSLAAEMEISGAASSSPVQAQRQREQQGEGKKKKKMAKKKNTSCWREHQELHIKGFLTDYTQHGGVRLDILYPA